MPGRPPATDGPCVVRSEERVVTSTESVPTGRLRIGKRVVTETRTVTVQVRREELYVEELPPPDPSTAAAGTDRRPAAGEPVLTLVLSTEEPVVTVAVRPLERVALYVDTVAGEQTVTVDRRVERVEVEPVRAGDRGRDR